MVKKSKGKKHPSKERLDRSQIYDECDEFNDPESNSENEDSDIITERNNKEFVLGLSSEGSGDSSDDDSDFMLKDEGGEEDQNEQKAVKSMGKLKSSYFGTDLKDERFHNAASFHKKKKGKIDEALEIEQKGALELQEFMNAQKTSSSLMGLFSSGFGQKSEKGEPAKSASEPRTKKLKIQKTGSDKLEIPVEDVAEETIKILAPLMEAYRKGVLPSSVATEYLVARYFLNINYSTCVSSLMMLKASGADLTHHPIEKRLMQFKHLYKELDRCKEKLGSELETLLESYRRGELERSKRKMLGLLKEKASPPLGREGLSKREKGKAIEMDDDAEDEDEEVMEEEEEDEEEEDNKDGRRLISYKIKKNKGLLPSRKKEQRNPRVKYKKKYQNKLKRRKGQVREVRKEIKKYGGEISGIKANLVKSIKLK